LDINELTSTTLVEPRAYQARIVTKAFDYFTVKNARSVLIESPTGSGKTIMALLACKLMQQEQNVRVGWVSMRRHLLAQAAQENEAKRIGLNAIFFSMFSKKIPRDIDMLVVDEAQHDAANTMTHIHNTIKPKYTLGMTATPFRSDRLKLCFDTCIKDAGIHRLIQEDYLSPYHHFTIPDWKPGTVAGIYVGDKERWGKSLIFFHKLAQCHETQKLLALHNVPCEVVSGETDVDRQLDEFSTGKLKVLLNCLKLTEGFDSPNLQTVFCRPSSKGPTVQMCGRVFRKYPGIDFKQLVQPEHTRWSFIRTAAPRRQFVYRDGHWLSVTASAAADEIALAVITTMATVEVKMPSIIKKYNEKVPKRFVRGQDLANAADGDGDADDRVTEELAAPRAETAG